MTDFEIQKMKEEFRDKFLKVKNLSDDLDGKSLG